MSSKDKNAWISTRTYIRTKFVLNYVNNNTNRELPPSNPTIIIYLWTDSSLTALS